MSSTNSVSCWIGSLKNGDADAAQCLWDRYAARLVELAHGRMRNVPRGIADEEDIAQSVFTSICRGAASGRLSDVKNRDDLWWLLLEVTKQKVVDHIRRETAQKRGSGRVRSESALSESSRHARPFTLEDLIGDEPTAEMLTILDEENQRLLALLGDDRLQQIAISRIEGFSVAEIANRLTISPRSVERKLRLIRLVWAAELTGVE